MERNSARPVRLLAVLSLFLIIAFLAVAASGFRGVLPGSMLFTSKFPNGYYVFYRLLEEMGHKVEFEKRYAVPRAERAAVVYATAPKEGFDRERYISWLQDGNTLVLIGNSVSLMLEEDGVRWGKELVLRDAYNSQPYKEPLYASASFDDDLMKKLEGFRVIYKTADGPVVAESRVGSGQILYVADPALFNNDGMHNLPNALLLDKLFSPLKGQTLYMRERSPEAVYDVSLIRGLLQGKGGYLSFQILILFVLSVMIMGKRFARPEKREGKRMRKVTEHTRAVGLFFHKARACQIVETVDSHYFRTIVCRNRKPPDMGDREYSDYGTELEDITEDEIVQRFKERQRLKGLLDKRRKYES